MDPSDTYAARVMMSEDIRDLPWSTLRDHLEEDFIRAIAQAERDVEDALLPIHVYTRRVVLGVLKDAALRLADGQGDHAFAERVRAMAENSGPHREADPDRQTLHGAR